MSLLSVIGFLAFNCFLVSGQNHMKLDFHWKTIEYEFPTEDERNDAIRNGSYMPENVIPTGMEVTMDRLFIATPRLRPGVWSTLNYIHTDDSNATPNLIPYPTIAMHLGNPPEIISPYSMKRDGCDRLWVPDSGIIDYYGNQTRYPPGFHIFNLITNERILKYTFPADLVTNKSAFISVALEVIDCSDIYAYFADVSTPALVVFSLASGKSWKISHPYFEQDPIAEKFNVAGINFTTNKGIAGVAISGERSDNYSTLYFSPVTSFNTFEVSTKFLRDPELAHASYNEFKQTGFRGADTQVGPIAYHRESHNLFYGLVNKNAIGCWNSQVPFDESSQGIVVSDNLEMISPSDIVTRGETIWVLSNKMVLFVRANLNTYDFNFRIFKSTIPEAVNGTVCHVDELHDVGGAGLKEVSLPLVIGLIGAYLITYLSR